MSLMKFYEGSEAKAQSYLDGLYLASDSSKLYYNGKSYTPDLTDMQNSIGTNVYTDSNYISKETNLTSAVLQLDEEIKATNDNLSLEHENAEATYAKKTELSGYLPLTGGDLKSGSELHISVGNSEVGGVRLRPSSLIIQTDQDGNNYYRYNTELGYRIPDTRSTEGQLLLFDGGSSVRAEDYQIGMFNDRTSTEELFGYPYLSIRRRYYDNITEYIRFSKDGVTITDKTSSDLLHAAGGTVSIQDIIDQANVPTNVSQLTNDAGYQTEAQVSAKVSALVNSAPETLDTLKELADALGNDPNFATTISTELGKKLDTSTYNADKATFALKSELPDMSQYTTTTNLQSTYLAKTDASNTYQPKGSYLTSIPSEYVTDTELNAKGYVTKTTADSTYQPKGNYLTSVSWDQVGSKPSWIGSSKPSYTWDEIGSKPSFATVATSGSYNDLSNKPSIPQPTVKAASGTLTLWTGTESEYNDIATKDPNTLYFILES